MEQYSQTLIPRDAVFVPSAAQICEFLLAVVDLGVMPLSPSIVLRIPSGRTREYPNPFTGGKVVVELKDQKKLRSLPEFAKKAAKLLDYEIEVSGVGRPKLPPIPIDFKEEYFVGVTCFVSSKLRSTSHYHGKPGDDMQVVPYRKPCTLPVATGVFSNPHDGGVIKVAGAGSAHFWVQFELGKFLFPEIAQGNLELLNPAIVEAGEKAFGVGFAQGCYWG